MNRKNLGFMAYLPIEFKVDDRKGDKLGDVVIGDLVILVEVNNRKEEGSDSSTINIFGGLFIDHQSVINHDQVKGGQTGESKHDHLGRPFGVLLVECPLKLSIICTFGVDRGPQNANGEDRGHSLDDDVEKTVENGFFGSDGVEKGNDGV